MTPLFVIKEYNIICKLNESTNLNFISTIKIVITFEKLFNFRKRMGNKKKRFGSPDQKD